MAKGGLIEFLVSGFPQAANGYIKAYSTKTTVLKSLYLDRGLIQLAPVNTSENPVFDNTISLNIYGAGQFYGVGLYTIVLMSSNGSVISTFDDVPVGISAGADFVSAAGGNQAKDINGLSEATFFKTDTTANTVTISDSSGKTILGDSSYVLSAHREGVRLILDGTDWYKI